jgi:uncharacterized Fe-S cluster protein YjdI
MEDTSRKYSHGALTIVWQPNKCIHSGHCFRELGEVFNPRAQPWVKPENATTERIIDQVRKCPSGALTYYLNLEASYDDGEAPATTGTVVEASVNGPLLIYGDVCVRRAGGDAVRSAGVTAFCRCGASARKPFCDGSHTRIGFRG